MQALIAHIRKYVSLTEEEALLVVEHVQVKEFKKKALLLKEGQQCNSNYFVEKGCMRLYFIDEKGVEQTIQFALENWWMTDYSSFFNRTPSQFYIQAIENSSVIIFEKAKQDKLFTQLPQLERYFRLILEKAAGAAQWRMKYNSSFSKEEMFNHFAGKFPGFVQRVPQYMLASFLGLTPEYLSEIRKKRSS